MRSTIARRRSSAATIEGAAGHIPAGDLGGDQPDIEGVAIVVAAAAAPLVPATAAAGDPGSQRHDLDVQLLPGSELDILVLVKVLAVAVDGDVVGTGWDVTVRRAARFRYRDDCVVHADVGGPQAI